MEPVKDVGGMSFWRSVSICSKKYVSTARFRKGKIICTLRMATKIPDKKYVPKIATFFLFLWNSSWVAKGVILFLLYSMIKTQIVLLSSSHPFSDAFNSAFSGVGFDGLSFCFNLCFIVGILCLAKGLIAPWHGAEHMVIGAYQRNKSINIEDVLKESPLHKNCGTRILVVMMPILLLSYLICEFLPLEVNLVSLILFACVLEIDARKNLCEFPVVWAVSRFIQKYFTTCYPGEIHIQTARFAMQGIISAHQQNLVFDKRQHFQRVFEEDEWRIRYYEEKETR